MTMKTIKECHFCVTKSHEGDDCSSPLKEEKEGGEDWLKELLSSMLELLGETGKAEASLLHHLAPAGKMSVSEET